MRSRFASLGKQAGATVSAWLHRLFGTRVKNAFGILMYHRVTDVTPGLPAPTWNVTPSRFRAQMEDLLARGYQFWSLRTVIERSRAGQPIPPKTTVVTFDDGYQSVLLHAWPVLKELNIPATVFVATSFVDSEGPLPYDGWGARHHAQSARDTWQALTWAQIREMDSSGLVEIGSHSHTHGDFRNTEDAFGRDLSTSLATLRAQLGRSDFTFSFPYGSRRLEYAGEGLMHIARQAGALCALTTETELASPDASPFGWGRFEVLQSDTGATLAAKLEGWYNWMGAVRAVFRAVFPPRRSEPERKETKVAT